jgi:hypothetical protein
LIEWFDRYSWLLSVHYQDPRFIFNIDETMLQVGENRENVFVMKDEPDPVVAEAAKLDHITLLLGIPARGDALEPLVILPRLTMPPLPADILDGWISYLRDTFWLDQWGNLKKLG